MPNPYTHVAAAGVMAEQQGALLAGTALASCSGDKTVRLWQQTAGTDNWRCTAILDEAHSKAIRCCAWSPSGRYLACASFDGKTSIWQTQGGLWEQVGALIGWTLSRNGSRWGTCCWGVEQWEQVGAAPGSMAISGTGWVGDSSW
jgi:hypothetical protein